MNVLVTGGAGYIGSATTASLLKAGHRVVVLDDLSRGNRASVPVDAEFIQMSIDSPELPAVLKTKKIDAVIHFAAFAYVGESTKNPALYYRNNTAGTMALVHAMAESGVHKLVFSSTCSLYGNPEKVPITEDEPVKPINPYASSKQMVERFLADVSAAGNLRYASLRYFNAAGAAPDGSMGESHEPEQHLIPLVLEAAETGKPVKIFGEDYPTPDGTCIRDYIHTEDLAAAHIAALEYISANNISIILNLGTGKGTSVREIVSVCEKVMKKNVPVETAGRREGDPAVLVADNTKAKNILGWEPTYGIEEIVAHAYHWYKNKRY